MKKALLGLFLTPVLSYSEVKAVIFDWGQVLASPERECVVEYLRKGLRLSADEMVALDLEKIKAEKNGVSDTAFWCQFAKENKQEITENWELGYQEIIAKCLGLDFKMQDLVRELKAKGFVVGLLSNVTSSKVNLYRHHHLYAPFDPCLLSCEIGVDKPDRRAYQILLDHLPFKPDEIVFIDDKIENIKAAKEMGIDGICFESYEQICSELKKRAISV